MNAFICDVGKHFNFLELAVCIYIFSVTMLNFWVLRQFTHRNSSN